MDSNKLDLIKKYVNKKFGDLTGVIQLDGHSNINAIYELCEDYKVDVTNKYIVGFGLGETTTQGIGIKNDVYCSIYYVDKSEYGYKFDEIEKKIKNDGTLRLKKENLKVKYSTLGKYIKRYEFIVLSELVNSTNEIKIEGEEDKF